MPWASPQKHVSSPSVGRKECIFQKHNPVFGITSSSHNPRGARKAGSKPVLGRSLPPTSSQGQDTSYQTEGKHTTKQAMGRHHFVTKRFQEQGINENTQTTLAALKLNATKHQGLLMNFVFLLETPVPATITVSPWGWVHLGIHPFWWLASTIDGILLGFAICFLFLPVALGKSSYLVTIYILNQ